MLTVRQASRDDLARMLVLFAGARARMRRDGNVSQWPEIPGQAAYPQAMLLEADIAGGFSYVIVDDDQTIRGTFYYREGVDPTYNLIRGAWVNDESYGVIHRIASDGETTGIVQVATDFALKMNPNVRVDTHEDNAAMIAALRKAGYEYCGIIYITDGSERLAFHLAPTLPKLSF